MSLRSFGYVLKSAADTGDCLTTKLFYFPLPVSVIQCL